MCLTYTIGDNTGLRIISRYKHSNYYTLMYQNWKAINTIQKAIHSKGVQCIIILITGTVERPQPHISYFHSAPTTFSMFYRIPVESCYLCRRSGLSKNAVQDAGYGNFRTLSGAQ